MAASPPPTMAAETERGRAKSERYDALRREAARLFAEHGFDGVSLEDIGAAVGISGPGVYRHFTSKRALLGAIMLHASEDLLDSGREVLEADADAVTHLRSLVDFHVDFAVRCADLIRVHDRDLSRLSDDDRHRVRLLQREYVDLWTSVLTRLHPGRGDDEHRVRAHAGFGLINSTSHSMSARRDASPDAAVRRILADMAVAALLAP
ncbi:TetR/AcrR family transcriptional regulator [Microbacterium dextranolyticum]|uniref:TetR family transcriptional regulator n=1 Tax=Microbacterium dextranolyticum TaxID=36806 RepID=A0A9W6HN28_9MICO|nr:TetR/AcrR family transcriptional regulator [Microbacterium dextranolyticum]MBM7463115.1 AcrR family transcriptional regulator [Microbacterium dextranolyticum]GLJ95779.1 TetR family transcriptional regulator [Microbacterium dextranolyticum]